MRSFKTLAGTAIAAASLVSAQTYTDCNPMNKTCTPDTGLDQYVFTTNFTDSKTQKQNWTAADGTTLTYDDSKGAVFNITKEGEAPTISSDFYLMFGRVDVVMQAAPGTGIVSSVVLESDDLDEIDWEWLGGNNTSVETNYFGKGNTTLYNRAIYYDVDSPTTTMHTYSIIWTEESIIWLIDDTAVRTLKAADADSGYDFPQTPLRVKLGNWCGGCSSEGYWTREWAGGNTTFDDAPYVMYVESVKVTNYNPAKSYTWTDKTGDYESIKGSNDTSVSTNIITATTSATSVKASSTVLTTTNSKGQTITTTSAASTASGTSFSQGSSSSSSSSSSSGAAQQFTSASHGLAVFAVSFVGLAIGAFML